MIEYARAPRLQVDAQQLLAMITQGDFIFERRNLQGLDNTQVQIGESRRLLGTVSVKDDQSLLTAGVMDRNQTFAIIKPGQVAIAHAIRLAMLQNRTFPVGQ